MKGATLFNVFMKSIEFPENKYTVKWKIPESGKDNFKF